ncbi:MAG TPA: tRNA (adenosine(37)-N6)-threonylcarbamoyltransferase complex ATPase subunit type 1 TsaE [Methylomirabilota bacterium]|nr:tRNA (adenosine(37)-N6)-threonylcarbamoyltransferase complex ATPase subunit type 1 TsaE [Methylomirabilota bacterium]
MPPMTLTVDDEAGTARLAEDLAMILRAGDVVAFSGDLGMGKSAFARALLRALADDPGLEAPSPTFTLVQTYELPGLTVSHFDLYRLGDPGELTEIGLDDAIRQGAVLVEWPERAGGALPPSTLHVDIAEGDAPNARSFTIDGDGAAWADRLDRTIAIRRMLGDLSPEPAARRRMAGDASSRRYERVRQGAERRVVMDWPRAAPQPPLLDGLSYPRLVHVQDDPLAFVAVSEMLRSAGFVAPLVQAADRGAGLIVMEDLGRDALVGGGAPVSERFVTAAAVLAEKDDTQFPAAVDVKGMGRWEIPRFDARAMLVELSLLPDWFLPLEAGTQTDPADRAAFLDHWAPLVELVGRLPQGLVLRDAIAANLVWRPRGKGRARIGFLDFQDAMIGPAAYDIMSLTTDVRLDLPPDLVAATMEAYRSARTSRDPAFDGAAFELAMALTSAQRNSKILGGFARLAMRDGKRGYLAHLPLARRRVAAALSHPVLRPVRVWYEQRRIVR